MLVTGPATRWRRAWRASSATASARGFGVKLLALVDELGELRMTRQRLTLALRGRTDDDDHRRACVEEVSALSGGAYPTICRCEAA